MDIASTFTKKNNSEPVAEAKTVETTANASSANLDPLASFDLTSNSESQRESEPKFEFNANETISTNDDTAVGGYTMIKNQAPEEDQEVESITSAPAEEKSESEGNPVEEEKVETEEEAALKNVDAAKMDFIRTYTKEYDDLVANATHAVELVLASIDRTVKEYTDEIDVPDEAVPFLSEKPANGKVPRFEDAQDIVQIIMGQATEAKNQSEQAAIEAAKIYDNIQKFKHDTNEQIADIRNRDEFGRPRDSHDGKVESDADADAAAIASQLDALALHKIKH
ncbi:MAG: hypothetical protein Q4C83_02130 [Candidatus Saccharibacteria bacterium]|nr:hypothetical protein [Candidatus Saccharibacteria bacterium]